MSGSPQTEAQRHLAALERLERITAAFASTVSHQTRSALVGIQGLSELIRDGDLTLAEVRSYAGDIFNEALKIDEMIGEMFELDRLETGQSPFRESQVDLNRLVEEAAERIWERMPALELALEPRGDSVMVLGDRDRLQQAVQKVIAFVVITAQPRSVVSLATTRHGDGAGVTVRSSSSRDVEFEDWLCGRYERYEQRPSAVFGAGLGLAIARAIIELHGGRIEALTRAQGGAEFRLTLPSPGGARAPEAWEGPAPGHEPEPTPSR